jgi:hypothetical protein
LAAPESGTYQVEVHGFLDSQYRLTVTAGTTVEEALSDPVRKRLPGGKAVPSAPVIGLSSQPPAKNAVPNAPIQPGSFALYLPLIRRN